jgi:hypothetical protein
VQPVWRSGNRPRRARRGRCPPDARATALLHDLYQLCPTARWQLRGKDLTHTELDALELLTHAMDEPYEAYVRRIANAPGPAGLLARIVKLADVEDHLAHPVIPADAPPYAWARDQLVKARARSIDAAPGTRRSGLASPSPAS